MSSYKSHWSVGRSSGIVSLGLALLVAYGPV